MLIDPRPRSAYALIACPANASGPPQSRASAAERLLGTLGGIDVFAVRGGGRSVTIGSGRKRLSLRRGNRPARALVSLELRSASTLSLGERAELFNAAYEGYVVPMHIDEAATRLDAGRSSTSTSTRRGIAYRDGEPVGLANLAVRGTRRWIGGVGVVASARRVGRRRGADARAPRARRGARRRARLARGDRREHRRVRALREARLRARPGRRGLDARRPREGEHEAREVPLPRRRSSSPSSTSRGSAPTGRSSPLRRRARPRRPTSRRDARSACAPSAQLQQYTGEPSRCSARSAPTATSTCSTCRRTTRRRTVLRELGGTVTVRQHEMLLDL